MPLVAYADEYDAVGSIVTVGVKNPNNLSNSLWSDSGSIDTGFSNLPTSADEVDFSFLRTTGGFIVDYMVTLPFAVDGGVKMGVNWTTPSTDTYIYTQYDTVSDYKYRVHWDEASKIQVLLGGVVVKEYSDTRYVRVVGGTCWMGMTFEDLPVETGGNELTIRFFIPSSACKIDDERTFQDRVDDGSTLSRMRIGNSLTAGTILISTEEDNSGLLNGIIEWLRGILSSITELPGRIWSLVENGLSGFFDTVFGWLSDIVKGITELPGKIWKLIKEGLEELFIPDPEYMTYFVDTLRTFMQEHLGIVWQSVDMLFVTLSGFDSSGTNSVIDIPVIRIPLGDTFFQFGGWSIDISPSSNPVLSILISALKTIVNIVCTFSVISALKRRFESLIDN